jgi:hypothetical protein
VGRWEKTNGLAARSRAETRGAEREREAENRTTTNFWVTVTGGCRKTSSGRDVQRECENIYKNIFLDEYCMKK